ncbi:MAG TPA: HlyD family efflux transporter periplasmic adaptor subunit [Polyangia bacterium]
MSTPRIRTDLQATPAEEGGIKYFDVSDPKSGTRMRMYDFEWLIAERMDGRRPFDEVASWARERLGIAPSASDLEEYARRLRELGFFDITEGEEAPARSAPNAPTMMREAPAMPSSGNGHGKAAAAEEEEEMPPLVAEAPLMGAGRTTPAATAPTMAAMPVATSERPAVAAPVPDRPVPAKTPAPKTGSGTDRTKAIVDEPSRSSAASIIGIVLVLAVVGGIVAYVKLMGGTSAAHVATVVATPREVVRLYDGAAAVKKSEGQTLSFGEAGKVSDVVAAGTEAKAGMPLATLESYAKVEKDLADVKDRATYYEKQLAASKAKNDAEGIKTDEAKVAEKKKLVADLEARAAKVRLVAPGPGTVAQVMVTAGADVQPGAPVVRLASNHNIVAFKLPAADAANMKPGAPVSLQAAAGGAPIAGRVATVEGDTVTVELPDDAAVKPGDSLRLVKARVSNVVPVPPSALVNGNTVFVLADGAVHAHKVTIVDRTPNEVLVGTGLQSGDQIVSSGADTLKDGEKASQ